ncbi:MAG: hypothetical protein ACTSRW_17320 [Candidatus Helarchaeota archaeon]
MKAFEKWNRAEHKKDLQMYGAQLNHSKERQKGWKAALELVNSKLWLTSGQVVNEVKTWIKEELEDEK